MCRHQRHVDVFEEGLGGDAHYAAAGLDEIVAGTARLFAAECVGKNEWFGELTGAHQKTGAVDGPLVFRIHVALSFTLWQGGVGFWLSSYAFNEQGRRLAECSLASGVTVRARRRRVNTIRIVQRWNSRARIGGQKYG